MKTVSIFLLLGMMTLAVPGFAQTSPSDSQTLKDILTEMRAIHADVRLGETTQILLTELQLEQGTVNTALQRRDAVRNDLAQTQTREKSMVTDIARLDDTDSNGMPDPVRKKQLADQLIYMKAGLVTTKARETQLTNDLQEAEGQLGNEQNKLREIQGQLDDQVKRLQPLPNS